MSEIYKINILSISENYIIPLINDNIRKLKTHFYRDELWMLNDDAETISIDESGGIDIPDIMRCEDLLFFSDKLKSFLDSCGVNYLFYKKVIISDDIVGIEEIFWIVSVPRIDCIDFEKSSIIDADEYDYNDGIVPFYNIENPIIDPSACGRYNIFRILGSTSDAVYVTDILYEKLKKENFIGLGFRKIFKGE